MDVGATSAFVTSMHSILFAAELYYGSNEDETIRLGFVSYLDNDRSPGGYMILIRDLVGSQRTRERAAVHLVGERGIKSQLLLPGASSISCLINAERRQFSIGYNRGTCVLELMDKAFSMTYVPIGSRRLCSALTNACHNMVMSSISFGADRTYSSHSLVPYFCSARLSGPSQACASPDAELTNGSLVHGDRERRVCRMSPVRLSR